MWKVVLLAGLSGCWQIEWQKEQLRTWEMADHEDDLRAARDAIASGRLPDARDAGTRLAWPDDVPGLPAASRPWLDGVRAGGTALAGAADLPAAADRLVAITASCAGCHRALGVAGAAAEGSPPEDVAWLALAFEAEDAWSAGVAGMGGDGARLRGAATWPQRRAAFASLLLCPPDGPGCAP